jgi:hypothetical protein
VAKSISSNKKVTFAEYVRKARDDDPNFKWLNDVIIRAGYARVVNNESSRILITAKQLASHFSVATQTLRKYIKGGLPVFRKGFGNQPDLFDLFDAIKWFSEKKEKASTNSGTGHNFWKGKVQEEQARKLKRINEIAEGKLIMTDELRVQLNNIGASFKSEAEAIGRIHGKGVLSAILKMIKNVRVNWEKIFDKLPKGGMEMEEEN